MHSYQMHIGDYAKAAMYLSQTADLAYRRMLDRYYDTERPLTVDTATLAGEIGMDNHTAEVSLVLNRHFKLEPDGWHSKRADEEIAAYRAYVAKASEAGKASGAARRAKAALNGRSTGVQRKPNVRSTGVERPLNGNERPSHSVEVTINHKPSTEGDSSSSLRSEEARSAQFGEPDQWREAVDGFKRQGIEEQPARRHIGKLVRDFGPDQAFRLLHQGIERKVPDLAGYVEGAAVPLRKTDAYQTSHMSDEDIERENQRGARPVKRSLT